MFYLDVVFACDISSQLMIDILYYKDYKQVDLGQMTLLLPGLSFERMASQ